MAGFLKRRLREFLLACLAFAWVGLPGCGGDSGELPTVPASGTVTYQGKPVAKGTIHFQPENGRPASAPIEDGKFTLTTYKEGDGAMAGKHKVAVDVTEDVPGKEGDTTTKYLIPQKYASPEQSGLSIEIPSSGSSKLEIDIK
jgi:hypothetical protein